MKLGRFKIFMFVKPSDTATMGAHRIGKFVSSELDAPITWNEDIAKHDLDTLLIVAGGTAFSTHRDDLGRAVLRSERVVYISNDYMSLLPKPDNNAGTMFRKAFRLRHKRGMRPVDHWTADPAKAAATPDSALINWNVLEYNPTHEWRGGNGRLFYYGSWRKNRIPLFEKYFLRPEVPTLISNASGRFEQYDRCEHMGSIPRDAVTRTIAAASLGLYVMDPKTPSGHPPANRFYEMLGAGLPMVFDDDCVPMLASAGYDVSRYATSIGLERLMRRRRTIAKEQYDWNEDFRTKLIRQFRGLVK